MDKTISREDEIVCNLEEKFKTSEEIFNKQIVILERNQEKCRESQLIKFKGNEHWKISRAKSKQEIGCQ